MLTVWEFKTKYDKKYKYELMIPKEYSHNFSIIVNESEEKQMEVQFEEINFKELFQSLR